MNRDDALKKIKKCMALSRSAEPHEAAAALRQAQKLMEQFQIDERGLNMADVSEVKAKAAMRAIAAWEGGLAQIVAEAFGCEHFVHRFSGFGMDGCWRTTLSYVFVGIDAAPTLAGYTFEVLTRQCARARLAHIGKQNKRIKASTKTARGDEFALGWVHGVRGLVERFAQPQRNETLLLEYMGEKHPELKKVNVRDRSKQVRGDNLGHRHMGHQAGAAARLDRGVGGKEAQGLLA